MPVPRVAVLFAALLAALGALSGCTTLPDVCRAPQQPAYTAELLFGRNIGDRLGVSERAWSRFFDAEIASRFPDGSTVTDSTGRWRDPARGVVVREPGKVVTIVLHDPEAGQRRVEAIVAAYKARFRQQSVGVIVRPACVSF